MKNLNYGIIGYGNMGKIRHQAMLSIGAGDPSKIYDPIPNGNISQIFGKSYTEIMDDPDIGNIIICTPNYLNKKITIDALNKGKNVFCEKPPCFNADELKDIIKVEKSTGCLLMYGFNHRHHNGAMKLLKEINSGQYGDVLWVRGRYGKSVDEDYFKTWRADPKLSGGGILIDQGIHMIDLFLKIITDLDEINANVSNLYWNLPGIEDNVFALLRNSSTGQCASLHSTMTQWRHLFSLEVFLQKGYMVLNGIDTPSKTYGKEVLTIAKNRSRAPAATWEDEYKFEFSSDQSWKLEMENFYSNISGKVKSKHRDSSEALKVMEIIDKIYANNVHKSSNLYSKLNAIK